MGVPGFFAWLLKKYKENKIILHSMKYPADILYLDANCLFHPQSQKVIEYFNKLKDPEKLEEKILKRIIKYINFLIEIVGPREEVFIAVDGVAPLAKMNQQRKRRFKSTYDNKLKSKIKEKYKIPNNTIWNNTTITPGTLFMERLHNKIKEYISSNKIKITYSSYHTPGEGEHKILQDIKNRGEKIFVIYGLDADLIFLSLASQKRDIFLLREAIQFNSNANKEINMGGDFMEDVFEELNFVSIDTMRKCINDEFYQRIDRKYEERGERSLQEDIDFTNDFVLICYLLGNDFLPHLPSIDIKTGGLDFIIDNYVEIFVQIYATVTRLTDKSFEINNIFLEMLLESLSNSENFYFETIFPRYLESISKRKCLSSDPYENALWELENLRGIEIDDPIKLGYDSADLWKFRYYEYYFGESGSQNSMIDKICSEYFRGIKWIAQYYFDQCPSWDWQYPFSNPPFISDLYKYFSERKIDFDQIIFKNSAPSEPFIQLLAVLPAECTSLLPSNYRHLITAPSSEIIDFYPRAFKIDMINKDMYWKCLPLLPTVDLKRIKDAVKNIKLSEEEKVRNKILNNYKNF